MASFLWRDDDGWPYPDPDEHAAIEVADRALEIDDDLLCVRTDPRHLYGELEPLERTVLTGHFGLDGTPARSISQLHTELGLPSSEVRSAYESGLAKLRTQLR